jgi:hypothetical protein
MVTFSIVYLKKPCTDFYLAKAYGLFGNSYVAINLQVKSPTVAGKIEGPFVSRMLYWTQRVTFEHLSIVFVIAYARGQHGRAGLELHHARNEPPEWPWRCYHHGAP